MNKERIARDHIYIIICVPVPRWTTGGCCGQWNDVVALPSWEAT